MQNGRPVEKWPGTVLLVDDEPKIRELLREFLEMSGFTVVTAESGEQALQSIMQSPPRVVLLDIRMPGMDGLLTLKHLRVHQPNLPVIIITQDEQEDTMKEAVLLGAYDYLIKPFTFTQLKTLLLDKIFTS